MVKDEALTILRRHPEAALRSFGQNVDENTRIGWDRFRVQLRSLPDAAATLEGIARIEGRAFRVVRWLLALVPLIVGILWAAQRPLHDRQLWNDALAMWISAAYFVGLSGLTFWTGPRIIFPAVPPFLAMVALLSTVAWPDRTRAPPDEAGTGRP
jgi:hypothetical protein